VIRQMEKHFLENETRTVDAIITVPLQLCRRGQNMGIAFVKLKDWKLRTPLI